MSKQRNEPKDILSDVMEYDEDEVVAGTSEDDKGKENTSIWPEHMQSDDLNTPKQRRIWKDWVQSSYTEPTSSNIVEFAKDKSYSKTTARLVIMKGAKNQRGLKDIRRAERLGVVIVAYEGDDKSDKELAEKYPLSEHTFRFAIFSYPDLVKQTREQYEQLNKDDIEDAIANYKETDATTGKKKDTGATDWNEIAKNYFINNPNATPQEIRESTGIEASDKQIWGLHANLVRYDYLDGSDQSKTDQRNATENDNQGKETGLTIELEFDSDEALELINGDSEPFDVRKRVVEKVVEKAFGKNTNS